MAELELAGVVEELRGAVAKFEAGQASLADEIKGLKQPLRAGDPRNPATAPSIRTGENPLSSRGYSFLRAAGYVNRVRSQDQCKVEIDIHNRLQKALVEQDVYVKTEANSFLMPFATTHMGLEGCETFLGEIHDVVAAGVTGADMEQVRAIRQKNWGVEKTLSWIDQTTGGALVAPPVMGELIELFRNNEALLRAGARELPLPSNGRMTWPRQTDATTAYWVGENNQITASEFKTGDLVLTAKKLGMLVKIPNELFRFSSVSIEQFIREDMMKSACLKFDKTALEGEGSTYSPKGILTYANITKHNAKTVATDGNTFAPEDIGLMIGKVEEQNAEFSGWIMRPLMYSALVNRRADAATPGDAAGAFLFDRYRSITDQRNRGRGVAELEGYPVVKSTNVSNTRVKGAGTNLSYIVGGNFKDVIMAVSGVLEFLTSDKGDTMIQNDQTWVRGVMLCDVGLRHEASIVLCDSLLVA